MKLASLFDGIGGFPLAATMLGIEPVWASEIEKFPIGVAKERFSNMRHLGSVCDIKGAEVEPIDTITFGSPCQDLSVAGKRAGMGEGTRSGLFSEAVRIIKEMRDGTEKTFPRYAVWENVPGAYSSNHGEDFRAVIESLAKVAEAEISIPLPQDGKWEPAGLVEGDGWSIAWRTLDAQFWGVPQRRKRIFLVADFGGDRASEIFFEREGVSRNPAQSGSSGQEVTGDVENGVRVAGFKAGQGAKAHGIGYAEEQSPTLGAEAATPTICLHATQDPITAEDRTHALGANSSQAVLFEPRSQDGVPRINEPWTSGTLSVRMYKGISSDEFGPTYASMAVTPSVRRLTPLECERLQGFPDNWTNIPDASDSARYKALGNSVAIPCVYFILSCLRRN